MSLSMREPSVSPRGADAVGSLLRGDGGGGGHGGEGGGGGGGGGLGKHVRKGEVAI